MNFKMITAPDENTLSLLYGKMRPQVRDKMNDRKVGAVAVIQDRIPEMIYYTDIASKAGDVIVAEITGNCPQTFTTIAIVGEVSSVKTALQAIQAEIT